VTIGVDGDLDRGVSQLIFDVHQALAVLDSRRAKVWRRS
jgi:hypothetical protein